MKIQLNGQPKEIQEAASIEELLKTLQFETSHVAVELNREVLAKSAFAATNLKEGDQVEVVRFVGGG